mmetsp:Transcript_18015/g.55165  ORF Transcript_18015/g.55165 Transcript_18015/m.55165 type:complete len:276 (-) Transcript_18015:737-1564(-)
MDLGVDAHGRVAPLRRRNEAHALLVVVRGHAHDGLPLREDDERRPEDVEHGVHARRRLLAARKREADVHAVAHAVRRESLDHGVAHLLAGVAVLKVHGPGRVEEAVEVRFELEYAAVVDPQALPNGVAALHGRVKRGDLHERARHEPAAAALRRDVRKHVMVPRVGVQALRHAVVHDGAVNAGAVLGRPRAHVEGVLAEVLVRRHRRAQDALQLRRQRLQVPLLANLRVKARRFVNAIVPVLRPQAVAGLGSSRPAHHGLVEGDAERLAHGLGWD